nr:hypothetical protein [uncultured Sphaerochaeta sp.]
MSSTMTLDSSALWVGLWIKWRGKKVHLISAFAGEDGLYQVHYDYKGAVYVDLDVPEKEISKAQIIEV